MTQVIIVTDQGINLNWFFATPEEAKREFYKALDGLLQSPKRQEGRYSVQFTFVPHLLKAEILKREV